MVTTTSNWFTWYYVIPQFLVLGQRFLLDQQSATDVITEVKLHHEFLVLYSKRSLGLKVAVKEKEEDEDGVELVDVAADAVADADAVHFCHFRFSSSSSSSPCEYELLKRPDTAYMLPRSENRSKEYNVSRVISVNCNEKATHP